MDRKEREKVLHKKLAEEYDGVREKLINGRYYSIKWIGELLNLLPKTDCKTILDLGCGTGIAYEAIKKKFPNAEYVGIDLSEDMINKGQKNYPHADFKVMDCENLSFKDNTFDLIIARSVLHHIPNPKKAISETIRVCKKGGFMITSEPHDNFATRLPRKISSLMTDHFDEDHTDFTLKELKELFLNDDLDIKKIRFLGYLAYPFAFPDIIKSFRFLPHSIFKILYGMDKIIAKIPLVRRVSWHMVIMAKKE